MSWYKTDLANVIAVLQSGSRPKGGVSTDTGEVMSLGGENIVQQGGVDLHDVKRVPHAFYEAMTKGHLQNRDVLINKDGANTGKVGLYRDPGNGPACINEHLFLLRGDVSKITQEYLYYTLLSEYGQTVIRNRISGSAQPGLKSGFINNFAIDLPESTNEQGKISEILETLDRAIEQTEALIAKQQRIKTGLMQDLLTKGIDEHGNIRSEATHAFKDSPLGRIPVKWSISKLSALTTKIVDGVHHTPVYVETGVPFLTITDLTAGAGISFDNVRFVTESDHKTFTLRADPRSDDVLVTKDGTLGVARIVSDNCPIFSIFVSLAQLRPKKDVCMPELIWSFFEGGEFKIQLGALSAGTGLAHIHLEHFREFLLRVPPIGEQCRVFSLLKKYHSEMQTISVGLEKLRAIKSGVMNDLLTGNRRVTSLLAQSPAP